MHAANAFSHFAVSSPRRVVPMTQASRLDEQLEKSGWRCDEPGHSAWATEARTIRMAATAAATVSFGMDVLLLGQSRGGLRALPTWHVRRQGGVKDFRAVTSVVGSAPVSGTPPP
jgi:hypothetical protein